jgi:putative endonuclease
MSKRAEPSSGSSFTRWPWWRKWFGSRSERTSAEFLRKLGYRILAANVADQLGEIDLLALDGETIVVVEVRSSETKDFESLAASVNAEKQKRLTNAALRFLQRRKLLNVAVRFDVLAICWPPEESKPKIRHYVNAFEATGRFQMYS